MATRCLYCGTTAADAPAAGAGAAGKPVVVTCPGCLRKARVVPGVTGACGYCALSFQIDDEGNARLGRTTSTPAATRAQVDHLVADLPSARLWDLVGDVLHRRVAFSELGTGEAERAIAALTLIASWPGDSPYWMPVALADAATLIPRVVFGVSDGAALHEHGDTNLLVCLALENRLSAASGRAAVNLLGVVSNLAAGVGFHADEPDQIETAARVQIRATLVEQHGGVELTRRGNQLDQEAPKPLTVAQEGELRSRIAASRGPLASYYIAGAIFGPSCRGGTAFSISRDAIAQRLAALGCDHSTELVEQLCLRMPPVFGG
jgi:hypothetical protein